MKRLGIAIFYAIGCLAMLYLALFAYTTLTGRTFMPGDPIHIFRSPAGPDVGSMNHVRSEVARAG